VIGQEEDARMNETGRQDVAGFAGARVLVTGAGGFIGSHLVEMLVQAGSRVRAITRYNSLNHWGWLENLPCLGSVDVVCGDIRDPHFCSDALRDIDIVFHLAALIAIPFSYRAPDSYVDTNVKGTLNICQAALNHKVAKVVQMSTSEVYGTAQYVPIDEKHPLQPQSPYSATKIASDALAKSFYHAFELPVVIARPFNTFGPRQSARAVIPTIITQIAAGHVDVSLGDLTATRDFTFVEDTCRGLLAIARLEGRGGEEFNIGSNAEISIESLFESVNRLMGGRARILKDQQRVRPAGSEVFRLRCDNAKLFEASGFRPSVSFEEGLRRTVAWFNDAANLSRYKGTLYNV
jgi:NAD dependent epimerase/dehydratase